MDVFSAGMHLEKSNFNRVTTGLPKLDELLSGGIPRNSITLVSGTPGSGKSISKTSTLFWTT